MATDAHRAEQTGVDYQALQRFVERRIRMYEQGVKGGPDDQGAPRVTERDLVTMWVTLRNFPGTSDLRSRIDSVVGVLGEEVCEGCGLHVKDDKVAGNTPSGDAQPQKARPLETGVAADQDCPKCGAPL